MEESRLFIVGANGQLGTALGIKYPKAQKADVNELDISDPKSVQGHDWSGVDVILNAAAYTNVDGAETPEGRISAWEVNAQAVANLTKVAAENNLAVVHISTDYVFDGTKDPHKEDEPLSPLSVYGASKAAGDLVLSTHARHYILRTSWVIGQGKNFVRTMLELGQRGIDPTVVADQVGRLTFTDELVRAIDYLLSTKAEFGTYNVTNGGEPASWAQITRAIFKTAGLANKVTDTSTAEYYKDKPGAAPRPLRSTLDTTKIEATGFKPTDWRADLENYVKKELSE